MRSPWPKHLASALFLAALGSVWGACAGQAAGPRPTEAQQGPANVWRPCAEASPDAFGAMAQARAEVAIAEAASTTERIQTINLLRESMYRTCERYLSGAINHESFVVQAGRDWRAMLAILAIEQLTLTAPPASTRPEEAAGNPGGDAAGDSAPAPIATDETQVFCLQILTDEGRGTGQMAELAERCRRYLFDKVRRDIQQTE